MTKQKHQNRFEQLKKNTNFKAMIYTNVISILKSGSVHEGERFYERFSDSKNLLCLVEIVLAIIF